jgi:hypothetical protein
MRVKTNRTSFSYAEIIADITNGTKTSEVMTSTQPLVPLGSMVSSENKLSHIYLKSMSSITDAAKSTL